MTTNREWDLESRAARLPAGRLIEQSVDPCDKESPKFFIYYFLKEFGLDADHDSPKPTILFVAGGPGQVNMPTDKNFGDLPNCNCRVVYFHIRGAGFSQMPGDNKFDKFLRTRYAVKDIERIREDLNIERWSAIIGHSYGSVLAHQYAGEYGIEKVERLILSAPLSRHKLMDETLQFDSLKFIYEHEQFDFLTEVKCPKDIPDLREFICKEARQISQKAEAEFGSVEFLIKEYGEIRSSHAIALKNLELDYSLSFFKALRRLRQTGWFSHDEDLVTGSNINVDTVQFFTGLVIANDILKKAQVPFERELARQLGGGRGNSGAKEVKELLKEAELYFDSSAINSSRVYYVMTIHDGLNVEFLKAFENNGNIKKAIEEMGGRQHRVGSVNKDLKLVDVDVKSIDPFDPKQFAHAVPTLLLKGGADPVSEGGQSERYLSDGLTGERMQIEFPGVGHSMALPTITGTNTRDELIRAFIEREFADFKNSEVLRKVNSIFKRVANRSGRGRLPISDVKTLCASGGSGLTDCEDG